MQYTHIPVNRWRCSSGGLEEMAGQRQKGFEWLTRVGVAAGTGPAMLCGAGESVGGEGAHSPFSCMFPAQQQYQQDVVVLQDKLRISNKKLEEYEARFKCQEENTQKLVLEYQARLEESEERLRRQQEDKEMQMKGIISR